jgi:acetyl-CoA C-acetyltransferase
MTDVVIAGIGQTPVGEHWELSLRNLSARAILAALKDAGGLKPQALYVGNFLGSVMSHQANLGALINENTALGGVESFTTEAAGASGAAALRMGYLAVASGYVDTAVVCGVEKLTDQLGAGPEAAMAQGMDYDFEAVPGMSTSAQAALLMRRYMHEYHMPADGLAGFAVLAHANGVDNPNAMYRKAITAETYRKAGMVSEPLNVYDAAPYADGAAAVVLTRPELARAGQHPLVRISGSAVVIDTLALHDRPDLLSFEAARISVERACRQAGILPTDADLFELSDDFSIFAALSLEAAGFARRGAGWCLARDGMLNRDGKLPVNTLGGQKARGSALGANGVYQAVEAALQLRGEAGAAQVKDARRALIQSLGGPASTAITHVLERVS